MAWGAAKLTNPLDKCIQNSRVPPVPDILSNHGLVKPGVVHQETGYLFCKFGGQSRRNDSPLLKEGDALFGLNVELLSGCKYLEWGDGGETTCISQFKQGYDTFASKSI